jgi:hypothetical protein
MSGLLVRALEHVHGHVGWLSALALCHPAILLRRPLRRALVVATAATALVTVTAALGAVIYPTYRLAVKPVLIVGAPAIGELFERKEHLGVAVLALAWTGLLAHALAQRERAAGRLGLDRVAFVAYAGAAVIALLTAGFGVVVATYRSV